MAKKLKSKTHTQIIIEEAYKSKETLLGIDEAGRGALAGPVVASAVIFRDDFDIIGLDDSKKLTAKERKELSLEIKEFALAYGIGLAWQAMIDKENILQATLIAMARAVGALDSAIRRKKQSLEIKELLIDGTQCIPPLYFQIFSPALPCKTPSQKAIVDGDAKVPVISAASVLAKVFRDELMLKFDTRYPEYNFAKHMGYGSKEHREAILKYGPCPLHRKTFRGVKKEPEQLSLFD